MPEKEVAGRNSLLKNIVIAGGAFVLGIGLTYLLMNGTKRTEQGCTYTVERSHDSHLQFARPLLQVEPLCESDKYNGIKAKLEAEIKKMVADGSLLYASVYLRDFDKGDWTEVGEEKTFHPSSLIKVPMLMAWLKMEERFPGMLDKTLVFRPTENDPIPAQTFTGKTIEANRPYTVRELLDYMITQSDNTATTLLNVNIDLPTFERVFTDLGLPKPNVSDVNYQMNARDISSFFISLYNANFLNLEHSEYALNLLSKTAFRDGLRKGLPEGTMVLHKFGEWGDANIRQRELHDCGIVYIENTPYLISVMTRGYKVIDLSNAVSRLTKVIHKDLTIKS